MSEMSGWKLIVLWIGCVIVGALVGYLIGLGLWKLGFELLGSAVTLVGAGLGGILVFLALLRWSEERGNSWACRQTSSRVVTCLGQELEEDSGPWTDRDASREIPRQQVLGRDHSRFG